jgi:hypothetical protein
MDIKLNAHNRYVEITGVDTGSAEELAEVALKTWLGLDPSKDGIEAGSALITEKATIPLGFADFSLEPPDVK